MARGEYEKVSGTSSRRVAAMSNVRLPFTQLSSLALFPILLLCLPGCFFGVGTVYTETTVVDAPLISQRKGHIWVKTEMPRQRTIVASKLLEYWGEPDEIVKNNGDEAWIYQFGLRWNGLMVAVIIPIPLAVPVGHDELSFSIDEDDDAHGRCSTDRRFPQSRLVTVEPKPNSSFLRNIELRKVCESAIRTFPANYDLLNA